MTTAANSNRTTSFIDDSLQRGSAV